MTDLAHHQAQAWLASGEALEPEQQSALEAHLLECSECRSYAAMLTQLEKRLPGAITERSFSPAASIQAADSLQREERKRTSRAQLASRVRSLALTGLALLLVLALLVALGLSVAPAVTASLRSWLPVGTPGASPDAATLPAAGPVAPFPGGPTPSGGDALQVLAVFPEPGTPLSAGSHLEVTLAYTLTSRAWDQIIVSLMPACLFDPEQPCPQGAGTVGATLLTVNGGSGVETATFPLDAWQLADDMLLVLEWGLPDAAQEGQERSAQVLREYRWPQAGAVPTPTLRPDILGCDSMPGVPGCPRAITTLAGRLAFLAGGRLVLVDLQTGERHLQAGDGRLLGWSPSGSFLLTHSLEGNYLLLDPQGQQVGHYDYTAQPPFWAPAGVFGLQDWLAVPNPDGSLMALAWPTEGGSKDVLPPHSLGADGKAVLRWSPDGWLALTPSSGQLAEDVSFEVGPSGPGPLQLAGQGGVRQTLGAWDTRALDTEPPQDASTQEAPPEDETSFGLLLSRDYRQTYYHLLDKAPGMDLFLAAEVPGGCSSCLNDALPLVSIDREGVLTPLDLSMLISPDAYAWNPVEPALLVVAQGGDRLLGSSRRLTLINFSSGESLDLTSSGLAAFEPAWSPSGASLAFAALPVWEDVSGSGEALQRALQGRAIYTYDLNGEAPQPLTAPPDEAMDGWPNWTPDGRQVIYARVYFDRGRTEIRSFNLESRADRLLLVVPDTPKSCNMGGCRWGDYLALVLE